MKIFSYVVARDFGFAPNPFHGFCTLATCKPLIRNAAELGDIIVGTAAAPRSNEIVFFMEVNEILTFDDYWNDVRFAVKKVNYVGSTKKAYGDNIYHTDENGSWIQEDSHHTNYDGSTSEENIATDTSSNRVLISNNFSYWGSKSPAIPPTLMELIKKGPGHKCNFPDEFKSEAKAWLMCQERGCFGAPSDWKN
ncbi:hypothetical protein A7J50_0261 [Pseudomonas antarctica]|uniref:Nucleotide modification associated domain-containing protein n=1 Tax=Pseudomonas antarctica TaxID=219572 RepID=A0A172YUG5_9PSED|nr:hypothetical protein [Pseudomonas antarctica]ANF83712.1 hypothetical protein A7J50_0261 [Pseudomonas antarctica]